MRILFWGTPDFAVPPLRALLGEGHDVIGVVTQPDRPRGRSRSQLDPSPVKQVALEEGLPVLQPAKPRGEEFLEHMRALAPDISVVVAYGHILPKAVIDLPARGTLNIHASLLPALRGAAPIQAALLEGMPETGVTIMQMVPALDAGDMLHVVRVPIDIDTTYGELHDTLAEVGALAIVQALTLIDAGVSHAVPQDDTLATYAAKIDRSTAQLDFAAPATQVQRVVRAFDPRPGAWGTLRGGDVKCFSARLVGDGSDDALDEPTRSSPPGTVRSVDADGMIVRCGVGAVRVLDVQPSGKPRMPVLAWSRGRGVAVGDQFTAAGLS
ncbi:MAG TPA: methionyl-tRNA formyltransferase [Gemmatimonas aurantiaca]|uniref:Methionyl-tRNA formyltransferase n=2 Tax=Gemmatimonas aurantiaca TaxID=173480 RepID=C1A606_GEMAT|nr:methionyl-tRNA formyltransferase [Gemmatimonas aurantiaca]BAH37666.1 methionyl-tRNA formyltransferase [Gemmatimonas aurantiaca T-27]HCT58702.1 methionyl-tRNA formyltransferase [Gemmatimonas aurantiaca]